MSSAPALAARVAGVFVLPVAVEDDTAWVVVTGDAVTLVDERPSHDLTRRLAKVQLDTVVPPPTCSRSTHRLPLDLAATLFAAEASGLADWATWTAAEHARVREQFGRPIGQFQGVKHRTAWMLADRRAGPRLCLGRGPRPRPRGRPARGLTGRRGRWRGQRRRCLPHRQGLHQHPRRHRLHLGARRQPLPPPRPDLRLLLGSTATWQQRVAELTLAGVRRELALDLPPEAEQVRAEVRAELAASRRRSTKPSARSHLAEHGYTVPHLPTPWGKGADAVAQLVIAEELRRRRTSGRTT